MTLNEFLKEVNGKESDIINLSVDKALKAVKQDGYALQYVKDQTEAICLAAVKQKWCALEYVDKSIFRNQLDLLEKTHNDIKSIVFNKSVNNDDKIELFKKLFKEIEK